MPPCHHDTRTDSIPRLLVVVGNKSNNNSNNNSNNPSRETKKLPLHLQYSGISLTTTPGTRSHYNDGGQWEFISQELALIMGDRVQLRSLRSLYDAGVLTNVLKSIAILYSHQNSQYEPMEDTRQTSLETLAQFLADKGPCHAKLACLRTLLSPTKLSDETLRSCLNFVTQHQTIGVVDCPLELHYHILLWELYAIRNQMQKQSRCLIAQSEAVAQTMAGAAKSIAQVLESSVVPVMTQHLDTAGQRLKKRLHPQTPMTTKTGVVALTYSRAAKRASSGMRETARWTVHGIRDVATRGIQIAANRINEKKWGERIVPHQESREVFVAVGTVGLAGLGAAAIVGEAVFHSTCAVAMKSGEVIADIVGFQYGEAAGQAVQDAAETTGNVLQTVRHVIFLDCRALARGIAKNTGKSHVQHNNKIESPINPLFFMDSTKTAAIQAVRKLQLANDIADGRKTLDQTMIVDDELSPAIRHDDLLDVVEMSCQFCIIPLGFFWN